MSYGDAASLAGQPRENADKGIAVPWYARPDACQALAARDIGTTYRLLKQDGMSQREIARLTGQSQSEVSEILRGRQVRDVTVLERIADGLGVPRELMRLSGETSNKDGAYPGEPTVTEPPTRESEDVRRRALLAATSMAALGRVVTGLGELTELALPTAGPLPSRLGMSHVHAVEAVTERLRGVARQVGGQAELFGAAAQYYTRWLSVPATDAVTARMGAALAELHTEAGWSYYDSGVDAAGYFTRALQLADRAGDGYGIANAAWHAGATLLHSGHPDDALKTFQLGQLQLKGFQPGKSTPATFRGTGSHCTAGGELCGRLRPHGPPRTGQPLAVHSAGAMATP